MSRLTPIPRNPLLAFTTAALVATAFLANPAAAQSSSQGQEPRLFQPSASRLSEASDDSAVLRRIPINLNIAAIEDLAIDRNNRFQGSPVSLGIELFDGLQTTFVLEDVTFATEDTMSLIGHLADSKETRVIFVVGGGLLAGSIHAPNTAYRIQTTSTGQQVLEEVDVSLYPPELEPEAVDPTDPTDPTDPANPADPVAPITETGASGSDEIAGSGTATRDSGTQFDVLIAYTATARVAAGSTAAIRNLIALGFTETNQALLDSGVIPSLHLVHLTEVAYTEAGNLQTDRNRLRATNDGHLDNIHALRDTHNADLVKLVVSNAAGGACGIAYLMNGSNNTAFESSAFAVTARNCISPNYTFGHELGHLFGCNHAPADPTGTGAFSYSFGYKDPSSTFRTIMAYNCTGGCTRVLRWSSPHRIYNGRVTGTATQNNATSINNVRTIVANFRDSTTTPPAVPAAPTFVWQTDFCRGFGTYVIGTSAGATYYEVWGSGSSSFLYPFLRYSGTNQSSYANWAPGWLRAKACNASGCSGWSVQRYARYYPVCY